MDPRMSVDGFEDTPKTIRCVNGWLSRASVMVRVMDTVYDPKSAIPSGGPERRAGKKAEPVPKDRPIRALWFLGDFL